MTNVSEAATVQLSPEEEQELRLADALKCIKTSAFHMKRALDKANLHEALKHSALLLSEMRTSMLSPQKYYELYIAVYDELMHLEQYFMEEVKRGTLAEELYEVVQHAGNIVPRLYLLCTVGSVYIKSRQADPKDILKDLVEMCKGVQHPTRGLFLRNYLLQIAKNKLPDTGNEYDGDGGSVEDSVDFIILNFSEMVRLWVRMEAKTVIREKEKREKERKELRVLVGFNLVRLSQLEGVDLEMYQKVVLTNILEIIIQSKDQIAQQYLMESIIQVFPDEFHLATLPMLLDSCMLLHHSVDLRNIFTSLMDRLAGFAGSYLTSNASRETVIDKLLEDMAPALEQRISKVVEERPKVMNAQAYVHTQLSFLGLVLKAYPGENGHVNAIFGSLRSYFERVGVKPEPPTVKLLKKLIMLPIEHSQSVLVGLELEHVPELLAILPFKARREVAMEIAHAALKYGHPIRSLELCTKFLSLLATLIHDEDDRPSFDEVYTDQEDFAEEQNLVARLVHLLASDTLDGLFKIYSSVRKQFGLGEKRIVYTLPPLLFCYLKLALRIHRAREKGEEVSTKPEKLFQHVVETIEVLRTEKPEYVLRLYLQAGGTADTCGLSDSAYECFSRALAIYEEEISDSKTQLQIVTLIIASLQNLKNISADNYDTLATKTCQYSSKLLKKSDQCQAVCLCSHLFWSGALCRAPFPIPPLQPCKRSPRGCSTACSGR
eukprot:TRINITY_DN17599_c0_g1_i2.p1 TRINITY_DN17599_c0_g1~~TRINITY_DN17599_c0_g1_i2.p1  ORF type:complete len:727 (+),score=193.00 TRINITY_DN17599_c0_g1_i2:28-2181(+)